MTSPRGAALPPIPPAVPRRLSPEVEAQCAATAARPLHRLAEAWWDVAAVERMGDWIKRNEGES